MLAAIKSFFGHLWGGSPDDSMGGGGGRLSDGGFGHFSAEYGSGWDAGRFGWGVSGETGLYTYAGNNQQRVATGTFGTDKRDGTVRFTIDIRNQPEMITDLQRRLAGIDAEVLRVETSIKGESSRRAEGIGSFLTGALAGDFSDNGSWSAVGGQTVIGLVPVVGQIADARDIIAAGRDVYQGKESGWAGLGIAAVAVIPGLDFLKGGSRVGRKLLAETAERGLSEVSREGVEQLGKTLSKEAAERASREVVVLSVAREEMLARLDILAKNASLSQNMRSATQRARNSLNDHLTQEDLIGALRDKHGAPVLDGSSRAFDHLGEVTNALDSLRNVKLQMTRELNRHPLGTDIYRRLSHETEAVAETIRRIEGFLEIR